MAGVDRISELPEPILQHILSFLSHKHAIQTSTLSKTWRHVGPTRPKIELRQRFFKKSGRASFLSVLGQTLQRYNHRKLSVDEFILEMSLESKSNDRHHRVIDSESISVLDKVIPMLLTDLGVKKFDFSVPNYFIDPSFGFQAEFLTELHLSECKFMTTTSNDHELPLFKGLKRLSLTRVHIKDETLEKIMCSCPLIEYLLVSGCVGLTTIPATIFQSESLTGLHLTGKSIIRKNLIFSSPTELISIKRLKTLSLERVYIPEETLEKIMCNCPLIERLLLSDCVGLTNIQLIKNNSNNFKHFNGNFYRENIQSIEIDAPTIETISIVGCPNWYGHDKYFFPCLKTLYLHRVKLSAELFESFSSSNFPSLEDLELVYCYGFQEIQLTVCSIKRLLLKTESKNPFKVTIYTPNIRNFEFYGGHYLPLLIFNSETTREWKTHLDMWFNNWLGDQKLNLPWLLQLSELLNSLRESQISLQVYCANLKVEETNDAIFCKPVSLEHVQVKGYDVSSYFPYFLDYLFRICRPRYIGMDLFTIKPITNMNKEKEQLDEFIKFKTIRNEGEVSRSYAWESDLEEISIQFRDRNSKGWHTVGVEEISFSGLKTCYPEIRFSVKWRD